MTNRGESTTINFYLKHVNAKTCRLILDKTDWDSFTDYELSNRNDDIFTCTITDGLLDNIHPDVNTRDYLVTEISLHHLTKSFQRYLLDNYLHMSLLEYETNHADTNQLYVTVPYYDYDYYNVDGQEKNYNEDNENDDNNKTDNPSQVNTLHNYFNYESDNADDHDAHDFRWCFNPNKTSTSTNDQNIQNDINNKALDKPYSKTLSTFAFKINPKTHKSYVLYRPKYIITDYDKNDWVKYSDSYVFPREWNLINDYRNVYFKNKLNGWVVGFSQKSKLEEMGATCLNTC